MASATLSRPTRRQQAEQVLAEALYRRHEPIARFAAQVEQRIRCSGCEGWMFFNDPLVFRVIDRTGELLFEGHQGCLERRLYSGAQVDALQAEIRHLKQHLSRFRLLLADVLDPRSWATPQALFQRIHQALNDPEEQPCGR